MNQWCQLGTSTVKNGSIYVRCKGPAVDEDGSAPDYGEVPFMCALGVSAVPYQPTEDGYAEALLSRDVPGQDGVVQAARDTRSAKIVGALKPGDVALHSTGPQQAAQVQCKEDKRQVINITQDGAKKTMMVLLDGDAGKIQITYQGAMIEIADDGDTVSLCNKSGAGILAKGENLFLMGKAQAGAGNVPGMVFMLGPPSGSPGGPASAPLFPCNGFAAGT